MIPFLIISGILTPIILLMVLYFGITVQPNGQSIEDASKDFLRSLIKHPGFYIYLAFVSLVILFVSGWMVKILRYLN